ncbi:two-component system sensor histidine kinase NtrB [Roseospira visakhapatnamensis]|uniref:histidine kinase n=1 Tax=Roseospira visakhapatnamensis TaxID=390880 RepID=A0A7W6W9C3_9PROT|nr:ATP-binding protein [Roseospira visakhapatnamensis]MBB4265341.1 two-component system nitrogen regulation sensor histidine kinase GlnL [Roseospira visakhapatnamensis]
MTRSLKVLDMGRPPPGPVVEPMAVLNAIASAVLVLDAEDRVLFVNAAGETLFDSSLAHLTGLPVSDLMPPDGPVMALVRQARRDVGTVSEHEVDMDTPRTGPRVVTVQASPHGEVPDWVVLQLHEHSKALRLGQQMISRGAARSVSAMARLLAHEVKNPLSGIRGAAQLLEQGVSEDDRVLTHLIRDEADRIVALVDRMDVFSDRGALSREPVNIHCVLEHVRRVAENGFARGRRIVERYDPSLPPVFGNRDQLVQVFLNLVKNAAEAVGDDDGEIVLATAYQHGLRLTAPGSSDRLDLPLVVSVRDNGPGIPDDLRGHLFEPFVTSKPSGSGLGLPLVAKIVTDHGGIVEFDGQPRRTVFRVVLPIARDDARRPARGLGGDQDGGRDETLWDGRTAPGDRRQEEDDA